MVCISEMILLQCGDGNEKKIVNLIRMKHDVCTWVHTYLQTICKSQNIGTKQTNKDSEAT